MAALIWRGRTKGPKDEVRMTPRYKRHRMAALHQSVTEELGMREGFNLDRRRLCCTAAVAAGPICLRSLILSERSTAMNYNVKQTGRDTIAIRPFHFNAPETELTELRRRISATRWPDRETVTDESQGVQVATIQELARYWGTDYNWRKVEARLNALPQFVTEIDGLDIHFIHIRSKHENALPLIVTHGWPGSFIEQLKIIDPLTNPTAHGASGSYDSTELKCAR
jgi:hypothetical protein